ncbi:DUF3891 family protein [Metabacillus litoralis]|uniref:DUF3891 family protein n=1 Tax=Metabacillus litoralis TaxID=152268 RepID=UPI001CFEE41E|nr:DUF3891 family protein [Metabacillus litoralis]
MIVYETPSSFVMTEQHEHALLSNSFAKNWKEEFFLFSEKKEDVYLAIAQHDRAWIEMDASPIWNERYSRPYSFIDFPESLKLTCYTKGINEVQKYSLYAGLICSIHYTNFFNNINEDYQISCFVKDEKNRQKELRKKIICHDDEILFHYNLLKFCDSFSLFVCMQENGVTGNQVHEWFQQGIKQPFSFFERDRFLVEWNSKKEIRIDPFPFKSDFTVEIPMKKILKKDIADYGILEAYKMTKMNIRQVQICSGY